MSPGAIENTLVALHASLAAKLPDHLVSRSFLPDIALAHAEDLRQGALCVVSRGGDDFAQHRGREGELATLDVAVAGYVLVEEDAPLAAVEQAELALMQKVLDWVKDPGTVRPLDAVLPVGFTQSQQLEHPYGWFVLRLRVQS